MNANMPTISVIVPSHNRCASLRRLLDGLRTQTYPVRFIEVLVVADGCVDGTTKMLQEYEAPFSLRVLQLPGQGAGAARNAGAKASTGSLLLFLDDDIQAISGLIEAHVFAHQYRAGQVTIGYLPLVIEGQPDLFRIGVRSWWESQFVAMRQVGYRYSHLNLFSGNFSLDGELFKQVGGFDATLPRREDYEFGWRLLKAGAVFTFAPQAIGYHHDPSDLKDNLKRVFQEGRGDVGIGLRHPELRPTLHLSNFQEPQGIVSYFVHAFAFKYPSLGDLVASFLQFALLPLEKLRFRRVWRKLFEGLRAYWYLRGAAQELGSRNALLKFFQGGSPHADQYGAEIEVDLSQGLDRVECLLDQERPQGVRIRYKEHSIGRIPSRAGLERVRGAHLRRVLATDLAWPLLQTLIMEAATTDCQFLLDHRRTTLEQRLHV